MMNTKEIIRQEIEKVTQATKESLAEIKVFAIAEVWRILQLLVALVIQLIENLANDLSSPEKKNLAMEVIEKFYDDIFVLVKVPFIPKIISPVIKGHIKSILMIFVSSCIDAMVITFRQVGVFKVSTTIQSITENKLFTDFIHSLKT